jgi:hypothetical protein
MYIQTLTIQVEAPSLEMSKFSLYLSGSCIPINPKLPPTIFSCFQFDFSVKSIKFSTRNSKYFVYILQQLPSMRRTHVGNPTWINSISPELCPPLTCERACSGNEIEPLHVNVTKQVLVDSVLECAHLCQAEKTCEAFKHKNVYDEVNCQVTQGEPEVSTMSETNDTNEK